MKTREFLRRYAYVYLYVAAFFLGLAALGRQSVETVSGLAPLSGSCVLVIDAGHGGEDGGTTGAAGTHEDEVNLAIAKRLEAILTLMGYQTRMTRSDSGSLATEGETIRARKQSDLRNRVKLANKHPNSILVSIHQNHFPDPKYDGVQVFFTDSAESLANAMQASLTTALAPHSRRTAKKASGIYLMEHITCPGLLVECGFLSNPAEEQKLLAAQYQKHMAAVMATVLAKYADGQI